MEKKRFDISGMTCSACSARIEKTVGKINGVKEVAVSLLTNSMTVEYDLPADDEVIMNAVRQIGYNFTFAFHCLFYIFNSFDVRFNGRRNV